MFHSFQDSTRSDVLSPSTSVTLAAAALPPLPRPTFIMPPTITGAAAAALEDAAVYKIKRDRVNSIAAKLAARTISFAQQKSFPQNLLVECAGKAFALYFSRAGVGSFLKICPPAAVSGVEPVQPKYLVQRTVKGVNAFPPNRRRSKGLVRRTFKQLLLSILTAPLARCSINPGSEWPARPLRKCLPTCQFPQFRAELAPAFGSDGERLGERRPRAVEMKLPWAGEPSPSPWIPISLADQYFYTRADIVTSSTWSGKNSNRLFSPRGLRRRWLSESDVSYVHAGANVNLSTKSVPPPCHGCIIAARNHTLESERLHLCLPCSWRAVRAPPLRGHRRHGQDGVQSRRPVP